MSRQIGELTSRRVGKSRRGESITDSEAQRNRLYQTIRTQRQGLVHPSTRPLVYYTIRGIILRETETAESRKSIALGNAQRNELRLSPSSSERAKSFANNRLRPVRGCVKSSARNGDVVCTSSCVSSFSIFTRKSSGANFQLLKRCATLLISGFQPFAVHIKLRRVEYKIKSK